MVELQSSKLIARVRFPSSPQNEKAAHPGGFLILRGCRRIDPLAGGPTPRGSARRKAAGGAGRGRFHDPRTRIACARTSPRQRHPACRRNNPLAGGPTFARSPLDSCVTPLQDTDAPAARAPDVPHSARQRVLPRPWIRAWCRVLDSQCGPSPPRSNRCSPAWAG